MSLAVQPSLPEWLAMTGNHPTSGVYYLSNPGPLRPLEPASQIHIHQSSNSNSRSDDKHHNQHRRKRKSSTRSSSSKSSHSSTKSSSSSASSKSSHTTRTSSNTTPSTKPKQSSSGHHRDQHQHPVPLAPLVPHAFRIPIPKPPGLPPPVPRSTEPSLVDSRMGGRAANVVAPAPPPGHGAGWYPAQQYAYVPIPRLTEEQVLDEMNQRKTNHSPLIPSRLDPSLHKNHSYWREVGSILENAGKLPSVFMRVGGEVRSRGFCEARQCLHCTHCRHDSQNLRKSLLLLNLRRAGYRYTWSPPRDPSANSVAFPSTNTRHSLASEISALSDALDEITITVESDETVDSTADPAPPEYTPRTSVSEEETTLFYDSTMRMAADNKSYLDLHMQEQFVLPPGYETLEGYVPVEV